MKTCIVTSVRDTFQHLKYHVKAESEDQALENIFEDKDIESVEIYDEDWDNERYYEVVGTVEDEEKTSSETP